MAQVIKRSRMTQDVARGMDVTDGRSQRIVTRGAPQRRFTRRYFELMGGPSP